MASSIPLQRDSLIRYFSIVRDRAGEVPAFLNPLFAGRDDELGRLHANVEYAVAGALMNRTIVVHGAPGAGKSELKSQFLNQLSAQHGSQVVPVSAAVPVIGDAVLLMRSLLAQLSDEQKQLAGVKHIVNELNSLISATAFGTGDTRGKREQQPGSFSRYGQIAWFNDRAEKLPSPVKENIFVLCVDEFQNLRNAEDSLCTYLRENRLGLKIVPIYFGLSDVLDVLRNAGASRLSRGNSLSIGSLKPEDAKAILQEFCNALEIEFPSGVNLDSTAEEVATQCDCWPQHLSLWMGAACKVLPSHEFVMTEDALEETNGICTQGRREYYDDRVRGPAALKSGAVRQAFGDLLQNRTLVGKDEIHSALRPAIERVQRDFDVDTFIKEAIHSGVLERAGMGRYRVPIPNLATYIYEKSRPRV